MVVPVLGSHQHWHAEAGDGDGGGHRHGPATLYGILYPTIYRRDGYSYPHAEEIERAGVGVVPLAHLVGRLVEVEHDSDTRHKKHQEGEPEAALVFVELEEKAYQTEQQRQEEVVILAGIVRKGFGRVALVSQADFVYEPYAALPVAVEDVSRHGGVNLILPAHEIPHKVAPVHPSELIVEEVVQVCPHGGLAVGGAADRMSLAVGVGLIEAFVAAVRRRAPHTGEKHLALRLVGGVHRPVHVLVFAAQRRPVAGDLKIVRRIVILAVEQRRGAVLLAAQVAHQRKSVVGLILIGGRFGGRTYDVDGEDGEADGDHGHAEQRGVEENAVALERGEQPPEAKPQQGHHKEGGAAVVRQSEHVHEEQVEVGRQLGQVRDEKEDQQAEDDGSDGEYLYQFPEAEASVFPPAVVEHEHQGRDGQQVEQVHTDTEAHQEGYQHYPAGRMGLVGTVVPHSHRPENHGGEEGRHSVHLTLHGGEPESVREAVGQSAHEAGTDNGDGAAHGVGLHQPPYQPHDGQIEEEDGEGGADGAHGVHQDGGVHIVAEHRKEARKQLEHRVSRRVANLQLIGRGDEFAAIPEGGGGLDGEQVCNGGHGKGSQGCNAMPQRELISLLHLAVQSVCIDSCASSSGRGRTAAYRSPYRSRL